MTEDRLSGRASVRLRLRSSDSLALRQMLPLPVLPQLPLESSSAVVEEAETHGNVGDGSRPPGPRREEVAGPTTSFEEVFSIYTHVGAQDATLLLLLLSLSASARSAVFFLAQRSHHYKRLP